MENTINSSLSGRFRTGIPDDVSKPSESPGEESNTQKSNEAGRSQASRGSVDTVEISARHTEMEPDSSARSVPANYGEAVKIVEDTKEMLYREADNQTPVPAEVHDLNPGDIINLLG